MNVPKITLMVYQDTQRAKEDLRTSIAVMKAMSVGSNYTLTVFMDSNDFPVRIYKEYNSSRADEVEVIHCVKLNHYDDRFGLYGFRFDKVIFVNGTYETDTLQFIESRRK